jgi:hypothetical protein
MVKLKNPMRTNKLGSYRRKIRNPLTSQRGNRAVYGKKLSGKRPF